MNEVIYCERHEPITCYPVDGGKCVSCRERIPSSYFRVCTRCSIEKSLCLVCGEEADARKWIERREHEKKINQNMKDAMKHWRAFCLLAGLDGKVADKGLRRWVRNMHFHIIKCINSEEEIEGVYGEYVFHYQKKYVIGNRIE